MAELDFRALLRLSTCLTHLPMVIFLHAPVWSGDVAAWRFLESSTAAAGATNSKTLRSSVDLILQARNI
jgi:hypothetical protein